MPLCRPSKDPRGVLEAEQQRIASSTITFKLLNIPKTDLARDPPSSSVSLPVLRPQRHPAPRRRCGRRGHGTAAQRECLGRLGPTDKRYGARTGDCHALSVTWLPGPFKRFPGRSTVGGRPLARAPVSSAAVPPPA